ncbi:MAG: lipid-transfer protein, partial [Hyphomicrobium sp.]|nr:lipid-transfer protein [Hyphomicrobium sp.]
MSVYVAGVGMIGFSKPGASETYEVMAERAIRLALEDAGLDYRHLDQAYAGFVYGDSTAGQKAAYRVGLTGLPIVNVNNNCSTGSTALYLARQAVASGSTDCVLAFGFEQMKPGALGTIFDDRPSPFERFDAVTEELVGHPELPLAIRYFAGAGLSHMEKYGTTLEDFARVRAKASRHASRNPLALFRSEVTVEEVMASPVIWPGAMHRMMACPPTCGAAAAIIVSDAFRNRHGLNANVEVAAQAMVTDTASTFDSRDMMQVVGYDMTASAAAKVYEGAGIGPEDI